MRKVLKFTIPFGEGETYKIASLPEEYRVVHVQQNVGPSKEAVNIWVELDPEASRTREVLFEMVGTGHPIYDEKAKHAGSVVLEGSHEGLVFHIYERS